MIGWDENMEMDLIALKESERIKNDEDENEDIRKKSRQAG